MSVEFVTVERAVEVIKAGQMVILLDDESRENEGDLVFAADCATPELVNFMVSEGRGLVCLPMAPECVDRLQLPLMGHKAPSLYRAAFTVSIESASGVTTGVSVQDRVKTIKAAVNPQAQPQDVISPGHLFPLRANAGGVLMRKGHTEGAVELAKLAGFSPTAVICEVLNPDGTASRRDQLIQFSKKHHIPILTIQQLVDYRIQHEALLTPVAKSRIPIRDHGDFEMTVFTSALDTAEHFVLVKPPLDKNQVPLLRIHCECITGDVFQSCRCDCGVQLSQSLKKMGEEGGVLIYLRQEGRGLGLSNKLKAYELQEQGYDTVDANLELGLPVDNRNYAVAYQILKYLGIDAVRLLTNNPEKIRALESFGVKVSERLPLLTPFNTENTRYLEAKRDKLGHLLCEGKV